MYRSFFNYRIGKNTYIGKSVINAKEVHIGDDVIIKDHTNISCGQLTIGKQTRILSGNTIIGQGNFSIGENSRIINNHFIDVWNNVAIGNNTWLAGRDSQLWTHGSIHTKKGDKKLSIQLGNDIYVGSNVNIAPGVVIGDTNLIGLGSVITSSFPDNRTIIAGNPSKVIKENIDWRENW
ncbi:acyltransferase [Ulvibacter antarcticus]|nr:hypothetical protein [Ulvibacter antarcticus]